MTEARPRLIRYPESGTFEVTIRCNLRCGMCLFRHDPSEDGALRAGEKTAAQWVELARQAAQAGTLSLTVTGGEPMLRPDFAELWEGLSEIGFLLTLYTNATLVTPENLAVLRKYPPHRIGATLYGASPETYERVTGNAAAWEQATRGMKALGTLPGLLEFRTTVTRDNLADVDAMEAWVKDNFGRERTLTHTKMVLKPVRGGCAPAEQKRLTPRDNIDLLLRRYFCLVREKVGPENFRPEGVRFTRGEKLNPRSPGRLTLYGCDAGMSEYCVTWDGRMTACQVLGDTGTLPFEEGFMAAWERFPLTVKPYEPDPACRGCEVAEDCMSCCATRFAETGDPGGRAPYVCANTNELAGRYNGEEVS